MQREVWILTGLQSIHYTVEGSTSVVFTNASDRLYYRLLHVKEIAAQSYLEYQSHQQASYQ